MQTADDRDQDQDGEDVETPLEAGPHERRLETSFHAALTIGGTPGWEAYQRYGYSIWRFDGLGWQVMESKCAEGAVCGVPPREAGLYVGEHRKKNCEPAPVPAELPSLAGVGVEP
jgi:hypothetical protein